MKKSLILLILGTAGLFSCGQVNKSKQKTVEIETSNSLNNVQNNKDAYGKYVYADSNGKQVIIENSFPKGGIKYTDPNGYECTYTVLWTRIINETDNPLELKINFPLDSFEIPNLPSNYFKVLILPDTMTLEKAPLLSYGLTNVESYLDKNIYKRSALIRTINSKESSGFYFLLLNLTIQGNYGAGRSGLSLRGQDILYSMSRYTRTQPASLIGEKELLCGSINMKNLILQK